MPGKLDFYSVNSFEVVAVVILKLFCVLEMHKRMHVLQGDRVLHLSKGEKIQNDGDEGEPFGAVYFLKWNRMLIPRRNKHI